MVDFAAQFSDPHITFFVDCKIIRPDAWSDRFLDSADGIVPGYSTRGGAQSLQEVCNEIGVGPDIRKVSELSHENPTAIVFAEPGNRKIAAT